MSGADRDADQDWAVRTTVPDAEISASLHRLDQLPAQDLSTHVEAYEQVYRLLQDQLSRAES